MVSDIYLHGVSAGDVFQIIADFWMNLQVTYDLRIADKALRARVRKIIKDNRSLLA